MKKYFYFVFFFTFFFITLNPLFALTQLPKNAFLKIDDEQKEVLILQQILNSNPDTIVAEKGVGSSGKETWLFGMLTKNALERFQKKYNLEVTGQINSLTLKKLNEYVISKNSPTKVTTPAKETVREKEVVEEKNIYLDKEENKPAPAKEKEPSYLDSMLDKYTSLISGIKPDANNIPVTSSYSAAAPYYNPQTGQYQSSPVSSFGSGSPYSTTPAYSSMNAPGFYSQNLPFGSTGGINRNGPGGGSVANGNFNGPEGKPSSRPGVTYENDGWVKGNLATDFGCGDSYATNHFGGGANGNGNRTSMEGLSKTGRIPIDQDCNLFLVSIPLEIQRYFFGNLPISQLYKKAAGTPIEVVNLRNKNCTVAPLWETGPGSGIEAKAAMDLTVSVKLVLGAKKGDNFPVRYRPLPTGQKGCEGYNFMDGNNRGLNIPQRK